MGGVLGASPPICTQMRWLVCKSSDGDRTASCGPVCAVGKWFAIQMSWLNFTPMRMLRGLSFDSLERLRGFVGLGKWLVGATCACSALVACSNDRDPAPPAAPDNRPPVGSPAEQAASAEFKLQSDRERAELKQRESELDPSNTGWDSEAFHNQTQARLKELAAAIEAGESLDGLILDAGGNPGSDLRPRSLRPVFEAGGLRVSRGDGAAAGGADPVPLLEGLQLLVDSLKLGQAAEIEVRFKQYLVSPPKPGEPEASTTALYKARASSEAGERVQNATWEITWVASGEDRRIKSIHVKDFEEIEFARSGDQGEATGLGSRIYRERPARPWGGARGRRA